jgi:hypothetical protein
VHSESAIPRIHEFGIRNGLRGFDYGSGVVVAGGVHGEISRDVRAI